MTLSTGLLSLMPHTVTVAGIAGLSSDGYDEITYSTGLSSWSCHYTHTDTIIKNADGTESLSGTTVWMASTSTFSPLSKFTVNGSTMGPVLKIEHWYDETGGQHHSKVYFG